MNDKYFLPRGRYALMKSPITIAIDGPAAAGKSTVAKNIAKKLNFTYIDTGAMYRALTLKALQNKIDVENSSELENLLSETRIELKNKADQQYVYLDEKDVSLDIRREKVSTKVSIVAQYKNIRQQMVEHQQLLAKNTNVVMDGRDIGTHVLPHATCKFFLIASVEERAIRRHKENVSKGFQSDLATIIKQIEERDQLDREREASPLIKSPDAIEIDTTSLTVEEVENKIIKIVRSKL